MQPTITRCDRVPDLAGEEHEAQITARGPDGRERQVFITVEREPHHAPGFLTIRDRDGVTVGRVNLSHFPTVA